ncbi:MAG: hypothetical protein IJ007_00865 [Oscillospiraceae bacterium]|nr:hypothetical protein [Oscillospiraceae bacterium]
MATYKFGNYETEVDVTDLEFIEKYEKYTDYYNEEVMKLTANMRVSEQMRYMAKVFKNVFDGIFGDGATDKMFGGKINLELYIRAFNQLIELFSEFNKTLEAFTATVHKPNREQRRKKKS